MDIASALSLWAVELVEANKRGGRGEIESENERERISLV